MVNQQKELGESIKFYAGLVGTLAILVVLVGTVGQIKELAQPWVVYSFGIILATLAGVLAAKIPSRPKSMPNLVLGVMGILCIVIAIAGETQKLAFPGLWCLVGVVLSMYAFVFSKK